jgi:hypothetical protein
VESGVGEVGLHAANTKPGSIPVTALATAM